MRFDRDTVTHLPPHAQEELIRWCEILVADGYNLGSPQQIWESAAYLVANGHTEEISQEDPLNVGETAVILSFASDKWDEIKNVLNETDNGADPQWSSPNTNDLPNLPLFTLLSVGFFTLLLVYAVKRASQPKS